MVVDLFSTRKAPYHAGFSHPAPAAQCSHDQLSALICILWHPWGTFFRLISSWKTLLSSIWLDTNFSRPAPLKHHGFDFGAFPSNNPAMLVAWNNCIFEQFSNPCLRLFLCCTCKLCHFDKAQTRMGEKDRLSAKKFTVLQFLQPQVILQLLF